jgi:hypothetical protein
MKEAIKNYISEIRSKHDTGKAREHAYRAALEILLNSVDDT